MFTATWCTHRGARARRPSSRREPPPLARRPRSDRGARARRPSSRPGLHDGPRVDTRFIAVRVRAALHRGLSKKQVDLLLQPISRCACAPPFIEASSAPSAPMAPHRGARARRPSSRPWDTVTLTDLQRIAVRARAALHRGSFNGKVSVPPVGSRCACAPPFIEAGTATRTPCTAKIAVRVRAALHRGIGTTWYVLSVAHCGARARCPSSRPGDDACAVNARGSRCACAPPFIEAATSISLVGTYVDPSRCACAPPSSRRRLQPRPDHRGVIAVRVRAALHRAWTTSRVMLLAAPIAVRVRAALHRGPSSGAVVPFSGDRGARARRPSSRHDQARQRK